MATFRNRPLSERILSGENGDAARSALAAERRRLAKARADARRAGETPKTLRKSLVAQMADALQETGDKPKRQTKDGLPKSTNDTPERRREDSETTRLVARSEGEPRKGDVPALASKRSARSRFIGSLITQKDILQEQLRRKIITQEQFDERSAALDRLNEAILDIPVQALGGARDLVQSLFDLIAPLAEEFEERAPLGAALEDAFGLQPGELGRINLPDTPPAESSAGKFARGGTEFGLGLVPGLGAARVARVGKLGTRVAGSLGAGQKAATAVGMAAEVETAALIAGQLGFKPGDPNFSRLLRESFNFRDPVTAFLQTDPSDREAENRLKVALEDSLVGAAAAPFFQLLRTLRGGITRETGSVLTKTPDSRTSDEVLARLEQTVRGLNPDTFAAFRAAVADALENLPKDAAPAVVKEMEDIARVIDRALADPLAPSDVAVAVIDPGDIERILLDKGPAIKVGEEIVIRGKQLKKQLGTFSGFGTVKILVKHGELSPRSGTTKAVVRQDIINLPTVVRKFAPVSEFRDEADQVVNRVWRVRRRDGEKVRYVATKFRGNDDQFHIVTLFVEDDATKPLSPLRTQK